MNRIIKKVAVLGSGIMGSRIACHFANIGVNVLLLDIVPKDLLPEEQKKGIVISILDNGNGFSKEMLEKIRQSEKIQQTENKSGLGIWSTDNRLKRYYGDGYGLEIVKSDYSGSTVTITIPTQSNGR